MLKFRLSVIYRIYSLYGYFRSTLLPLSPGACVNLCLQGAAPHKKEALKEPVVGGGWKELHWRPTEHKYRWFLKANPLPWATDCNNARKEHLKQTFQKEWTSLKSPVNSQSVSHWLAWFKHDELRWSGAIVVRTGKHKKKMLNECETFFVVAFCGVLLYAGCRAAVWHRKQRWIRNAQLSKTVQQSAASRSATPRTISSK